MPVKKAIFDKKNILVVGGAGFVGSNLCDELVKTAKVICLDNFITGDQSNIAHLLANPDFKFINHDIINPIELESRPELAEFKVAFQGVQEIYFLASPTSPKAYVAHPIETLLVNSVGLRHALDLAVKYESSILFASAPAVYGAGTGPMPIKEDYVGPVDQFGPRACYAEAKRFGEALVNNYRLTHKVNTKIARIFNCYGPRLSLTDGRMIPEMISAAYSGTAITVYGQESEFASYFYITDLIRGLMKLMESGESGPVNMASEWKMGVTEIAKKIIALTNSKSVIEFKDRPAHFEAQPLANISLAKEKLGWFPIILMDEGLQKTIDYLSAQKGIRRPETTLGSGRAI
ncbi:MAG: NAD-dependent epimerase/dehydratase family protein [Patescibacteria group bacterium]|jgi:nucleoside-diphosphate-sugar epimerase